jgi:TolB protein
VAASAAPALAAFPGQNGKIAFSDGTDIWSVNADGSNPQQLTHSTWLPGTRPWSYPEWSPDGTKIAYQDSFNIIVMNADGSNQTNITGHTQPFRPFADVYSPPSWSPDGTRIAFSFVLTENGNPIAPPEIWTANPDGSNRVRLMTSTESSSHPRWHPDGTRIAFFGCGDPCSAPEPRIINVDGTGEAPLPVQSFDDWSADGGKVVFDGSANGLDVFAQSINGSGLDNLTDHPAGDDQPNWSPDGTRIVFSSDRGDQPGRRHLWIMDADGSNPTQLTSSLASNADWQPIPPPPGYPRPLSASPLRVPLVTAFLECDGSPNRTPNRTHGPPLEYPSCNPAVPISHAKVGTPDSTGSFAKSVGVVRYRTIVGAPGGADDADVSIRFDVTDVLCRWPHWAQVPTCGAPNSTGTPEDYAGELRASVGLRITDRDNGGPPDAGTVSDTTFSVIAPCTETSDTTIGSSCSVNTTADAVIPGSVKEGKRTIWQLGQVTVYDGGPDGDAETPTEDAVFLRQGIFVP